MSVEERKRTRSHLLFKKRSSGCWVRKIVIVSRNRGKGNGPGDNRRVKSQTGGGRAITSALSGRKEIKKDGLKWAVLLAGGGNKKGAKERCVLGKWLGVAVKGKMWKPQLW